MGEAPGAHATPTASPWEPTTPKRPPKRLRPETPGKAIQAPPTPKNWQPDRDMPPASPSCETPQIGLAPKPYCSGRDEVLEIVSVMSQKVSNWEEKSLQGAVSLGKDIRALVLNFSRNLATGDPTKEEENHQPSPPMRSSYAGATKTTPNAPQTEPQC
ncbi:uncharacterized protein ASPGLDRAFT_34090 [Aspergillus glaucus CBS 516.65]|uniref:Uncharacterized protein n=1 Tax=Aspergillus glaucus CBS 516.65 TaxID=1160497 RepID=A0A1L9VQN1_ASPGL|nr:hypothetical protein ASPGLDRAFT_34090 [Aspergillus glaucus CBS 516.65]OJJ86194.1 hypothetical protein ASPGLDRAFT_34090 [Aspergillus glaucus CBS 516.65]